MTLRLATFNVENLFERAKVLNTTTWAEGEPVLQAFERFNLLANTPVYADADKQAMLEALETLQVLQRTSAGALRFNRDPFGAWALLRENRGDFIQQPRSGDVHIVASGRGDWIGWVELVPEPVDATAIRMTAKVIDEVAADILCVVEAEDRPALVRMNTELLGGRYGHVMLVDGNDPRGIDIGLFCDAAIEVASIRSHVDVADPATPGRALFSRDCPVYQLRLAGGAEVWVLLNHLKSQSFTSGNPDPLRSRQSAEVRAIYDRLRDGGAELVAVMGDFNKGPTNQQPPQHPTLEPLLGSDSPLVDAATLQGSTPDRVRGPSSRAACATGSTTSCSPHNWRTPSPPGRSSARACGAPQPTRTRRRPGTSSQRSPSRFTPRPTTPPSGSTSTSEPATTANPTPDARICSLTLILQRRTPSTRSKRPL